MSDALLPPTIFTAIRFQARLMPHAIAVEQRGRRVSYPQFVDDIERATQRLRTLGLQPGQRAAVYLGDAYLHWIVSIALERLRVVSVSITDTGPVLPFTGAQVLFAEHAPAELGQVRFCAVSPEWLAGPVPPATDDERLPLDTPLRMVLSSGTTGRAKKVVLTAEHMFRRVRGTSRYYGLNASARSLSMMSPSTIGGYLWPLTTWCGGGTVILPVVEPGYSIASQVIDSSPNIVFLSPAPLAQLVEGLPAGFWSPKPITVYVAGGAVHDKLNAMTRQRLTQSLFVVYGSTEVGTATIAHAAQVHGRPGDVGFVVPLTEVEIVDTEGRVLPVGEEGEIRLRADGMVSGYADERAGDPGFRDGWFYPGDSGRLLPGHTLQVTGRTVERMNIGGIKIAPEMIEAALADCPATREYAVFSLPDEKLGERACIAVVAEDGFDPAEMLRLFVKGFPRLPHPMVVRVAAIPRNTMGKVPRAELRQQVQALLASHRAGGKGAPG